MNIINKSNNDNNLLEKKTHRTGSPLLPLPTLSKCQNKYPYYCSLCGAISIISTSIFDSLPRRRTDDSIICLIGKVNLENYLNQGKLITIHRGNNKYEKQYTYTCKNCGTFIAYQSTEFEDENMIEGKKEKQLALFNKKIKKIIYILSDALVPDPQQSSLYIEIDKIKSGKNNLNSLNKGYSNLRIKKN